MPLEIGSELGQQVRRYRLEERGIQGVSHSKPRVYIATVGLLIKPGRMV
jgi:hypothetical protein